LVIVTILVAVYTAYVAFGVTVIESGYLGAATVELHVARDPE